MDYAVGSVSRIPKMAKQSALMAAEDGLIEFRWVVCTDAIDEVLHMLGLAIAGLFA